MFSTIDYAIDQIRAWVNPTDFDTALIRARKLQEDGTTAWLLRNNVFENWKALSEDVSQQINTSQRFFGENTFWLHGAYAKARFSIFSCIYLSIQPFVMLTWTALTFAVINR